MARVYRIDVSLLIPEQKQEVDNKLRAVSFMVLHRMSKAGYLIALDAIEERHGDFEELDRFKSALGLPDQCTVMDVTGWNLMP